MTEDDEPTDFFIILRGEVGVFTPRNYTSMKRELVFLDKMITHFGKSYIEQEEIQRYTRDNYLQKIEIEFLSNLKGVQDGVAVYKTDYIHVKLGGLIKSDFNYSLIFNEVK